MHARESRPWPSQNCEPACLLRPMDADIRANLSPLRESSGLPVLTGSSRVKIVQFVAQRVRPGA